MQIYQVPGVGYFEDVIRTFKHRTLTRHGTPSSVPSEFCEPLPIAQYLLARTDDGTRVMGLAEGYFLDQMHDGYESIAPELATAVAPLCPFEKLAFFQTIYVEPEFRTRAPYLDLCLALIYLGIELGAESGICFTNADSEFHRRLYENTGGRLVAHVDVIYSNGTRLSDAAYYFNLQEVCAHPRLERVLKCCHFDMEMARETYSWRYDHTEKLSQPLPDGALH
jgi:hypothetical protein